MAFLVKKEWNNGYYCCCHRTWDDDGEWYEDKEEALAQFVVPPWDDEVARVLDVHLNRITIEDGSSGELVAEAELNWLSRDYDHFCWSGQVEGKTFEIVIGGNEGESWVELEARLREEKGTSMGKR
jgi:hypothetical protein